MFPGCGEGNVRQYDTGFSLETVGLVGPRLVLAC